MVREAQQPPGSEMGEPTDLGEQPYNHEPRADELPMDYEVSATHDVHAFAFPSPSQHNSELDTVDNDAPPPPSSSDICIQGPSLLHESKHHNL